MAGPFETVSETVGIQGCDLLPAQLIERARRIRLVLTDVDGVLTDTGVYFSARGEELKRFSMRDGMGVALLREAGIETGIVTGENSGPVAQRAKKLQIPYLYPGASDKGSLFGRILEESGTHSGELAYIGDDVNDLALLGLVGELGLTAAPADGMPSVRERVHYLSPVTGGHGAFRAFADWLLALRQQGAGASSSACTSPDRSPERSKIA